MDGIAMVASDPRALRQCSECKAFESRIKYCAKCYEKGARVFYCSKVCQKHSWARVHRYECYGSQCRPAKRSRNDDYQMPELFSDFFDPDLFSDDDDEPVESIYSRLVALRCSASVPDASEPLMASSPKPSPSCAELVHSSAARPACRSNVRMSMI